MPSICTVVFRQVRLNNNSDQLSNSGSLSLLKQFDIIIELIYISLLKVKDILKLKISIALHMLTIYQASVDEFGSIIGPVYP
jgi:hypothetical protein